MANYLLRYITILSACCLSMAAHAHDGKNEAEAANACFVAPAALDADEIRAFLASPQRLLVNNPQGGLALSNEIRRGVGSSRSYFKSVIDLSKKANDAQLASIGSGLGRVAKGCASLNPEYAAQIQLEVLETKSERLIAAFVSASDEFETAALSASASSSPAGASAIGGNGVANGGAAGAGGDDATPTASGVFDIQRTTRFVRVEVSPFN